MMQVTGTSPCEINSFVPCLRYASGSWFCDIPVLRRSHKQGLELPYTPEAEQSRFGGPECVTQQMGVGFYNHRQLGTRAIPLLGRSGEALWDPSELTAPWG